MVKESEKRWVFRLLIFVAGFYGAYTLGFRGGVFCNAQTANMALFAMSLGSGNWLKAAGYLLPLGTYLVGTVISEVLPGHFRRQRWPAVLMAIQIAAVIAVGFIPAAAPHQISQVIIVLICAMQSNTFRESEGLTMASTFCTVHFRQFGVNLTRTIRRDAAHPEAAALTKAHGGMILCFMLGGVTAAVLGGWIGVRAIWFAAIPLAVLLTDFLRADNMTKTE